MEMKDLFVSIIIITRNRASLLRHCLERVLSQPYPHKEIIVVDSSSNDESEQVVAGYPEVISVRLRGQRNNRPQAYNEGIAASSGDIIAFVDDDAMVQPGWLIVFVPTMAVVHFSFRAVYSPYFLQRPLSQFSNGRNDTYFAIKNFGIKPRTLAGQLSDTAICCGRAAYLTLIFTTGMVAHV